MNDRSQSSSRQFWNKHAQGYAKNPVSDKAAYQKKLEITRTHLRPDMNLLEFGCGTGSTALVHALYVKHIHAIDFSANMIKIAKAKAETENITNITFSVSAIDELHVTDESFDAVLGLSILHLLDNKQEIIAKIHRILKSGGVFVSSTACLEDGMKFFKIPGLIFKILGPIGQFFRILPILRVFTKRELKNALINAGFAIEYSWQPEGWGKSVFIVARKP